MRNGGFWHLCECELMLGDDLLIPEFEVFGFQGMLAPVFFR